MTQEVNHTAEAWLNVLRSKIDAQVRALLHPHHIAHEPGGKDAVRIPVIGLDDVVIATRPVTGNALTYVREIDEGDDYWTAGAAVAGGEHEAYMALVFPVTVQPLGPINRSVNNKWVIDCNAVSDGAVSGSAGPGFTFTIAAGGNEPAGANAGVIREMWPTGTRLAVNTTSVGDDASYLAITWLISDT